VPNAAVVGELLLEAGDLPAEHELGACAYPVERGQNLLADLPVLTFKVEEGDPVAQFLSPRRR
jgi:hypothetical protein